MKWLVFLCVAVVCCCFPTTVKIGVYRNPPLIDFSDGKVSGLYAQILEQILSQNNWKAEYVFDDFNVLLNKLKDGQIDLMTAVAYTPDRSKLFDFNNQAVILNWGVICMKGTLKNLLDLQNKVVAIVESDVYGDYFRKQAEDFKLKIRYLYVRDYEEAFKAVKNDLADACVVSRIFAQKNASRYSLNVSGIFFSPLELRFGLPKGSEKNQLLIQAIDSYLYQIKSDQEGYNQLLSRYLGTYVEKSVLPDWVKTILTSTVIVIGLFVLWTTSLRKMVTARTSELNKTLQELHKKKEELLAANEEITAQSQELEAMNEELNRTLTQLEKAIHRFTKSMDLLDRIATFTKDEEFCWNFIDMVRSVVPTCSVAFSYMNLGYFQTKDGARIILTIGGHDLPYTFDEKVYETISIESANNSSLTLFNHSEQKLTSDIINLVKSLLNIARVFLKLRTFEANERQFVKRINDVLITILNYHEPYTASHSNRSSDYAMGIAKRLFLDDEAVARVYWASLIHDIGKIAVPREILNKSSKLSPEEFEVVKTHPVVAADLLRMAGLDDIAKIVRHHHERFDGAGYPDGLRGEQIPIESRIIAVVDAYDAMTSERPYRRMLTNEEAIEELKANSGTQFDPLIVRTFIELLKDSKKE